MNCNLSLVDPNYNGAKLNTTYKALYLEDWCFSRQGVHFQNKFPHCRTSNPGKQWTPNKEMSGAAFPYFWSLWDSLHSAKSKKHKLRSKADRGSSPALLFHNSVTLGKSQHLQSCSLARKRRIIMAPWSAGIFNKITEVKCRHILNSQQALAVTIRLISLCGPLSC